MQGGGGLFKQIDNSVKIGQSETDEHGEVWYLPFVYNTDLSRSMMSELLGNEISLSWKFQVQPVHLPTVNSVWFNNNQEKREETACWQKN